MTYKHLRGLIRRLAPPTNRTLKNCRLVIDGKTFFKDSYKNSGCQSLLGGEYDRYADYLRNLLKPFKEANVTCYVIFNGCMDADIEERLKIHQNILDRIEEIDPEDYNAYCEPIFTKDVIKEVLDELDIKYYVTENDSSPVLLSVASFYDCPILTKNIEYSLIYRSCICPRSLRFDPEKKILTCTIFKWRNTSNKLRVKHSLLPLFFTLLDEKSVYFKKLALFIDCVKPKHIIRKVLRWTRWQVDTLEETLATIEEMLLEKEWIAFVKAYEKNVALCYKNRDPLAINHFEKPRRTDYINQNEKFWFKRAVGCGKIPVPYINLIKNQTFSGSWVIFDKNEEDAMLSAIDIVFYVKRYLDFKEQDSITFIGREKNKSVVREIHKIQDRIDADNPHTIFGFLFETMPEFDTEPLETIPEECCILIIALVYFCQKKRDANFAYCVLLSYVMLGPVSARVGTIKRSNFMLHDTKENGDNNESELKTEDCLTAVDKLMDFFYMKTSKKLNRKFLNYFAGFQHCLQHMNYMNRVCGNRIKSTVYQKSLNASFVYNTCKKLKNKECAKKYFEKRLKNSSVYQYFEKVLKVFDTCMASVGLGLEDGLKNLDIDGSNQ